MHDRNARRGVEPSLLAAIVDQFIDRPSHPVADLRQFEKLLLGLLANLDAESAAGVLRPLCFHPETPPEIFARMLDMGGDCAELALEFSAAPSRDALRAIARQGAERFAVAVARRADLNEEIAATLAERASPEPRRALAANRGAPLNSGTRRALVAAARDDRVLARILLDRDDFQKESGALFLAATRLERTGVILDACRRALAAGATARRRVAPDVAARLEAAAVKRDREAMAAIIAAAFDCRRDRARAIACDDLGEALALALSALGFNADAATRIFLCADAPISHDADRVRRLVALVRATPQQAATQLIAAVTGAPRTEQEQGRAAPLREQALAGPGWRRAAQRSAENQAAKLDQSA